MESDEISNAGRPTFEPKESFRAWEKLRWIYNLAVLLTGLLAIILFASQFKGQDLRDLIWYGLLANLFYFLGSGMEMVAQYLFKGNFPLHRFRVYLFIVATVGSMVLTFVATWLFYHKSLPPLR